MNSNSLPSHRYTTYDLFIPICAVGSRDGKQVITAQGPTHALLLTLIANFSRYYRTPEQLSCLSPSHRKTVIDIPIIGYGPPMIPSMFPVNACTFTFYIYINTVTYILRKTSSLFSKHFFIPCVPQHQ